MDSSVQSSSIVRLNSNGGIESTTKILSESDDIPQFKTTFSGLMINHDSEEITYTVHEDYTDHTNATYMQMWSMKFHEVSGKNFKKSDIMANLRGNDYVHIYNKDGTRFISFLEEKHFTFIEKWVNSFPPDVDDVSILSEKIQVDDRHPVD